jgi:hypothetical protein
LLNLLEAGECIGEMSYVEDGQSVSLRCRYQFSLALLHSLVERLAMADDRLVQGGSLAFLQLPLRRDSGCFGTPGWRPADVPRRPGVAVGREGRRVASADFSG